MRRALLVPALRTTYHDTLLEAAALADQPDPAAGPGQPAQGWLEREASRLLELVRSTAYADKVKPFSNDEFDAAAAEILTFARTRGALARRLADRFAVADPVRHP
jgi:hypothetical protein